MVKKILSLSIALVLGFAVFAQPAATPAKTNPAKANDVVKAQTQNPAAYACPKCFMISKGSGQCDHCKMDKVQLGTYFCTQCMKSAGAKPGNCPSCKIATTQMTRRYCAKMGGTPIPAKQGFKPAVKTNDKSGV